MNDEPSLPLPDLGAIMAAHIQTALQNVPERRTTVPEQTFSAASLKAWLDLAKAAKVPSIPAEIVGSLSIHDWLNYDNEAIGATLFSALDAINDKITPGSMLRLDCCAPMGVKHVMSQGFQPTTNPKNLSNTEHQKDTQATNIENKRAVHIPDLTYLHITPDDPRAYDIVYDFPSDTIDVLKRPWVNATQHTSHPVEFRAYVQNGQVVAVSNYYPQRDLPNSPEIMQWGKEVVQAAQKIIQEMVKQNLRPWMPHDPEDELTDEINAGDRPIIDTIHCSLDFLVDDHGQILFLEAGPGIGWAHPCCFLNLETHTVKKIDGFALSFNNILPIGTINPEFPIPPVDPLSDKPNTSLKQMKSKKKSNKP